MDIFKGCFPLNLHLLNFALFLLDLGRGGCFFWPELAIFRSHFHFLIYFETFCLHTFANLSVQVVDVSVNHGSLWSGNCSPSGREAPHSLSGASRSSCL
jgi:hypothetical protein